MANPYDPTDPALDVEAWDDMAQFTFSYPPKISSAGGYWGDKAFNLYIMPMVELRIIVIFFSTQVIHFFLRRFGFSKITSEILAGLLITVRVMHGDYQIGTFVEEVLSVIAKFNYMFFLFLMGVKMDITSIRALGRKIWAFGLLIVLLPLTLGAATTLQLSNKHNIDQNARLALFKISSIHSMTLFAVISCFLSELKILNSELGKLALSVATVSDMVSLFLYLIGFIHKTGTREGFLDSLINVACIATYIAVLALVIRPAVFWVIKKTPEGAPVNERHIFIILAMAFGFAGVFFIMDLCCFLAPYLLGLALPSGPPLGSTLDSKYNSFIMNAFLPFFVSFCSSNANFLDIEIDHDLWQCATLILLVIIVTKFFTCLTLALYCGLPRDDSMALALILSSKGVIEIANYTFAWELDMIPGRFNAIAVGIIFLTSSVIPILVRYLYNPSRKYAGYTKRSLVDCNPKLDLSILACIYRSENISPTIILIDSCSVSKEKATVVHALHLLTLSGQSAPVFISHGLHRNSLSSYSSSNEVILSFMQLARNNSNVVSWNAYTAISPPELMDEDICMLALDKGTSLVILPFHRIWTIEGHPIDDSSMRVLNSSLLERAPCSLGILVDRGHLGTRLHAKSPSNFNVCMIFLGGKDDREALTLAKRMAVKSDNILTILRINCNTSEENGEKGMNWENILDSEVLKDVKYGSHSSNIVYREIWIDDGNHMVAIIRSLVGAYHLIIVGRRYEERSDHTAGLEIWSDFPELGIVGDLLATGDIDGEFSILVVKQQVQIGVK